MSDEKKSGTQLQRRPNAQVKPHAWPSLPNALARGRQPANAQQHEGGQRDGQPHNSGHSQREQQTPRGEQGERDQHGQHGQHDRHDRHDRHDQHDQHDRHDMAEGAQGQSRDEPGHRDDSAPVDQGCHEQVQQNQHHQRPGHRDDQGHPDDQGHHDKAPRVEPGQHEQGQQHQRQLRQPVRPGEGQPLDRKEMQAQRDVQAEEGGDQPIMRPRGATSEGAEKPGEPAGARPKRSPPSN